MKNDRLNQLIDYIKKAQDDSFTGKITATINMNCGGIGAISLNIDQNLDNIVKK